jgi:hypothetical protein
MQEIMGYRSIHKGFWPAPRKRSLYVAIASILFALVVQIVLGHYSAQHAIVAPPESDLFLDNLPVVNLGFLIVSWAIALWVLAGFLLSISPKRLVFGLKAIALFIIVRALFMCLTREGIYPNGALPDGTNLGFAFYKLLTFQGNLFFSGHTGFPFLMSLIFWDSKFWRRFFLGATILFGAAVLFAHVHYSIDVFAAPFITYGVFVIASKIFPEDYALVERT